MDIGKNDGEYHKRPEPRHNRKLALYLSDGDSMIISTYASYSTTKVCYPIVIKLSILHDLADGKRYEVVFLKKKHVMLSSNTF